jgi:hypothetical protein
VPPQSFDASYAPGPGKDKLNTNSNKILKKWKFLSIDKKAKIAQKAKHFYFKAKQEIKKAKIELFGENAYPRDIYNISIIT